MSNEFNIYSYVGVGDVRFGMSSAQVEHLLGPAVSRRKGFLGEITEYRRDGGLLATYAKDSDALVELGFSENILELQLDGKKLFATNEPETFSDLVRADGRPYETVGFIVLLELGITLTGFHNNSKAKKAVTVFVKGRWDDEIAEMKPFKAHLG